VIGQPGAPNAARRLAPVIRLAPAKVNLTLAVLGRNRDGFHDLHSVMVPLDLADVLTFARAPAGTDTLHVEGHDPGPAADNLVMRAIADARRAVGAGWVDLGGPAGPASGQAPALAVRLDKRIPVAAGLGGGSSDAAAAIDGALEAWGAVIDPRSRLEIAARLGSDVPFFLAGGPALIEGRGERLTPLAKVTGTRPGVLLVSPSVAVSTGAVYAAFDEGAGPRDPGATRRSSAHLASELAGGLSSAQLVERAGVLAVANDLFPAAAVVLPGLIAFRRSLARLLRRPIGQAGSGPTAWALYPSSQEAAAGAELVRAAVRDGTVTFPGGAPFIIATTLATGPATTPASPEEGA
jgi:4-diphosphocytidyl-2-C-methyl-D-erythritol kinase